MKLSLALGPRRTLSRQTAWGCLTTNLALPGFGSLVAGRASGYPQAALSIGGMVVTMVFGIRLFIWYLANWSRLNSQSDPFSALEELWLHLRWPLLGLVLFLVGWLWALATSLQILHAAKENSPIPPPLS